MSGGLDLDRFRALLEARRQAILGVAESSAAAADTVELDQTRQGRLSRMDAMQQQAMSRETNRRRDLELTRIEAALRRMAAGDYGYCTVCGEPVATARLEVDPAATRCIHCAE